MVTRSDSRAVGLHPRQLLRPGGPLYPTDAARTVHVASQGRSETGPEGLSIGVRLRGEMVVWDELMYPGADAGVIEDVRFHLGQYMGEIERVYAQWGHLGPGEQYNKQAVTRMRM